MKKKIHSFPQIAILLQIVKNFFFIENNNFLLFRELENLFLLSFVLFSKWNYLAFIEIVGLMGGRVRVGKMKKRKRYKRDDAV
jgi:hypothetical protein